MTIGVTKLQSAVPALSPCKQIGGEAARKGNVRMQKRKLVGKTDAEQKPGCQDRLVDYFIQSTDYLLK